MAAPVKLKTWTTSNDNAAYKHTLVGTEDAGRRDAARTVIDLFLATGATIVASCAYDGSGSVNVSTNWDYGWDSTDRWATISRIWCGSAGYTAWIVLELPENGAQIMLVDSGSASYLMPVYFSPSGGYSGGDPSNQPTAADSMLAGSSTNWWHSTATTWDAVDSVAHIWSATDGSRRLCIFKGGILVVAWNFEVPRNAASWWTTPFFGRRARNMATNPTANEYEPLCWEGTFGLASSDSWANQGAHAWIDGAHRAPVYWTADAYKVAGAIGAGYVVQPTFHAVTGVDPDGAWPCWPIGLHASVNRAASGEIADMYWAPPGCATGDLSPSLEAPAWVKISDVWYPWSGAAQLDTGAVYTATARTITLVTLGADVPDTTAPVVELVSPAAGTELAESGFITVRTYDVGDGLLLVSVHAIFSDETDPVPIYWRSAFQGRFAAR